MDGEASLSSLCPYGVPTAWRDLLAVFKPLHISFWLVELTSECEAAALQRHCVLQGFSKLHLHFYNKIEKYNTRKTIETVVKVNVCWETKVTI